MEELTLPDTLELVITAQVVRESGEYLSNTSCHIATAAKAALQLPEGCHFFVDSINLHVVRDAPNRPEARYRMSEAYCCSDYNMTLDKVSSDIDDYTPPDTIVARRTATLQK